MSSDFDEPTQLFPSWRRQFCQDGDQALLPVLTIACHPEAERLGEVAPLDALWQFSEQELNRHWPEFRSPASTIGRGLSVPHVSRKSLRFERTGDMALRLHRQQYSAAVTVNGEALQQDLDIGPDMLQQGVEIELGDYVLLLLKCMPMPTQGAPDYQLIGASESIQGVRERIAKVAPVQDPVLIRGATGSGKELVAQAIYEHSQRCGKPFISVNIAALQPSLAVSELFGAVKGSYTGATSNRKGYFQAAHGGTLFLDEIGEASAEVQAMLLRALESHEVMPVGANEAVPVDVRIIAATDANLEQLGQQESFKQPLLHRLSSYQIFLSELKQRSEDIPALFRHFLKQQWLQVAGDDSPLPFSVEAPWLSNHLMRELLHADWPGNVRQLRNLARQLVIDGRGRGQLHLEPQLRPTLYQQSETAEPLAEVESATKSKAARRKPSQVSRGELAAALRDNRYELQSTAEQLGISRASVYQLIARHPDLKNTTDYSEDELKAAYQLHGGDVEAMMEALQVSQIGLRRRLRGMGLDA